MIYNVDSGQINNSSNILFNWQGNNKNESSKKESEQVLQQNGVQSKQEENIKVPQMNHLSMIKQFLNPSYFSTSSVVVSPFNPKVKVKSILKIAALPHLQTFKDIYSHPDKKNPSSISFANWTSEQQGEAVKKLQQLNIPMNGDFLAKVYTLLQTHEESLCRNPCISYPALFKVIGNYQEEEATYPFAQLSCELEIHTDKKASLIFRKVQDTFIAEGTSKAVWKVFALGKSKVTAYSTALFRPQAYKIAANEENCLLKLKEHACIAKVYRIFYYSRMVNQRPFLQQIIDMKYYPTDLLNILMSPSLTNRVKMVYSIQLMQAIEHLHARGIVHRDIKPENILVSKKGIVVTDFGLSSHIKDPKLKKERPGSACYAAPELFKNGEGYKYGFALDIWSAGCILWILWKNSVYPWYEEVNKGRPNIKQVLEQMHDFDFTVVKPEEPISFLIWNMMRFEHNLRWSASKVLRRLNEIATE